MCALVNSNCANVHSGSTPFIENHELNFRFGSISAIRSSSASTATSPLSKSLPPLALPRTRKNSLIPCHDRAAQRVSRVGGLTGRPAFGSAYCPLAGDKIGVAFHRADAPSVRYSDGEIVIHDGFERLFDRFFVRGRSVTKPSSVSNTSLAIPLISIEAPYCLTQE
jgi:hypothetical protein